MHNILVVGAGFTGSVIARELADSGHYNVLVVDERNHIAGNCHTKRDNETNVMEHVYGPHIFNTSNEKVWQYVNKFDEFMPYTNRVKAVTRAGVFSLPINLLTINQLFGKTFNPREAEEFVAQLGDKTIAEPRNFEEQALKMLGKKIYETFFLDYTIKQWGCHPRELSADVLKRLPIRFNYDDNYYHTHYQGIPRNGYTNLISNILDHPAITVELNTRYEREWNGKYHYIFYTGAIDAYFSYAEGRLGYRTIYFERFIYNGSDYQGNPVINYCDKNVPYTRVHEHKHFTPWEDHDKSLFFKEFSKETEGDDIPFYPKSLPADKAILARYKQRAQSEFNTTFVGRLATYRYLDMHHVIDEALTVAESFINYKNPLASFTRFPVNNG
ncbi:UDP-galactopyranose mutase [Mucilaginibacter achroorhodeus]|uniref:UDP-galactopyranose mutase n=1 Tax=Mucilaginibacter achroorhodeus TaxID=2599294 RepID=A0A563U187_9SPHI|nr:UDP-galactopyranose mutase [Mucilaginibacter achroorhodeus]TWR25378.1 UDP-galactopyranose mutase [Mucilaginibacter achroorhodeus]